MLTMDLTGTKLRSNLIEWAEKAGAKFHRSGHEWRSACPLHGGHENSAFAVYTDESGEQKWTCYSGPCGSGDVYDFVQTWQDCDLLTAYQMLGGEQQPDPVKIARAAADHARLAEIALQAEIERAQRALDELRHAQSWLAYHQNMIAQPDTRDLWRKRGISDDWQNFWKLGYCPSFHTSSDYVTPSITIPVFGPALENNEWPLMNIRHRLLNPPKPNDKYRPDRPGLQSTPFIANPFLGFDTDPILVVEGEIKAAVSFLTIFDKGNELQVIGIPGKTQFRALAEKLAGHDVYICFDPDAGAEALEAARTVGGKIMSLSMKIDDAIIARVLDARGIRMLMRSARKL